MPCVVFLYHAIAVICQLNCLDVFIVQDEVANVFVYVLKDSGFVVSYLLAISVQISCVKISNFFLKAVELQE